MGGMPRVLLTGFCAVPGPRRVGVQLRHVIRALTPLHSVDLLVVREGEQAYVERQGSVRVLRVPTHESGLRAQIQAFQRALRRQLEGADYDVVHCRDSWSGLTVLEARARLGYAVVYDLTRSPLGETTFDAELDAQYARDEESCLLGADLVLAPTPAAVKALAHRGKPERVVLAPPGVDVDRFDWEELPRGGPPRILYVGSIDPGRGVRVLIRAMAAIAREVDCRLTLAGSIAPKFDAALREGIRELGLHDKVEVLGPIDHDQLPALIATATVCIVPAAADLQPNPTAIYPTKLLEYMACRRPIVAPRRETVSQVVENNREALLFEPGDPLDLARKVLRLLDEPLLRDRIASHAYERVRRDYTASAARRAIRAAYAVVSDRFEITGAAVDDDAPKVELLADDDFEATVFEEAPAVPAIDTALNKLEPLHEALAQLEADASVDGGGGSDGGGSTSSESVIAPPSLDETAERAPVASGRASSNWTDSAAVRVPQAEWAVAGVEDDDEDSEVIEIDLSDDGTPVEGVLAVSSAPIEIALDAAFDSAFDSSFVAGEIDVPSPPAERGRDRDTPAVELTAVPDPDTGSRTPAPERIQAPPAERR